MEMLELVAEWFKHCKTDLHVAKQLFENMHPRPPKIHDLNRLCEMCGEIDSAFNFSAPYL